MGKPKPESRLAKQVRAALESVGNTGVKVWWEPIGPALEMCGHSGGWFFSSDQHRHEPIGHSAAEAVENAPLYKVLP